MRFFLIFIWLLVVKVSFAQYYSLSGSITDISKLPHIGATVKVLTNDSQFVKGDISNANGKFEVIGLLPGNYIISITSLGYEKVYISKSIVDHSVLLAPIYLTLSVSNIKEVTINAQQKLGVLKGDTLQYNSGAFKTNTDANAEELLTKMPGVTQEDGKLKVQGEVVKTVLVDGKPFFGDDPNAVLKNIPAEIIDKIQIFDQKSSQSILTGFDDGNTTKTINFITKTQFRNGIFGKVAGGIGPENKYKATGSINFFKDKRRISVLINSNTINEQNFSAEDLVGVMSGSSNGGSMRSGGGSGNAGTSGYSRGGRSSGSQGNDGGNFLVDSKNGIAATQSFGLNMANSYKKLDISGSYFLNYSDNTTISRLYRQFISNQTLGLNYNENSNAQSYNTNHRLNLKLEWKPNSNNSITFQPKISLQLNKGNSDLNGKNMQNGISMLSVQNKYETNLDGLNASLPLQYKHTYAKKGRSLSCHFNPGYSSINGTNKIRYSTSDMLTTDTVNQHGNLNKEGLTVSSAINYTEPISLKSQILFTLSAALNQMNSENRTFTQPLPTIQEAIDTSLSSIFKTRYWSQAIGTSYRYQVEKWNLNCGFSVQRAQLNNTQLFPLSPILPKTFYSLLPNASFHYKINMQKNLRLSYNSSNNVPSIDQLQTVINNKNSLLLSTGNTDLKQDWQNNLSARFTAINSKSNTALFLLLSGSVYKNYIVNSTFIAQYDTFITPSVLLSKGSQLTKPINMDGYFNVRSFVNYSFPVTKIKSKLNFNCGAFYSETPTTINQRINFAQSSNANAGASIVSNISVKLDFTLAYNIGIGMVTNSMQRQLNSRFINQTTKFKIQANPWKGLILVTDLSYQNNKGLSTQYNINYLLWNAALGYKFLKDKQADIRLSVFDVMNQNTNLVRNITETYYEDIQTNSLQRYFMVTFTYNLKYYKNTKYK